MHRLNEFAICPDLLLMIATCVLLNVNETNELIVCGLNFK